MSDQLQKLLIGTYQVIPQEELAKKLARGKPLIIKLGADPTSSDLHLGHAVVLSKLRQFQDFGHHIIFLIGDFTARIGDPTGRSKTRPPLTEEHIKEHTKTYFEQVSKILDPNKLTVRYNAEWLDAMTSKEWVKLCAQVTLARLIERDDFAKRLTEHQPIGFHELLYPLMQGYDSVVLKADVELGGTDQTFNLLMGRYLQEHYDQEPQVIMTVPLLLGLDGTLKMSKSYGNAIGLNEPADQAYGKLMSISDDLMWQYYEVLLHTKREDLDKNAHPMDLKKALAYKVITRFWSKQEADFAQQQFEQLFQKKDLSSAQEVELPLNTPNPIALLDLLKLLQAVTTSTEARRLIDAGAVTINEEKITQIKAQIQLKSGMLIKVGKHRFYKLK